MWSQKKTYVVLFIYIRRIPSSILIWRKVLLTPFLRFQASAFQNGRRRLYGNYPYKQ